LFDKIPDESFKKMLIVYDHAKTNSKADKFLFGFSFARVKKIRVEILSLMRLKCINDAASFVWIVKLDYDEL